MRLPRYQSLKINRTKSKINIRRIKHSLVIRILLAGLIIISSAFAFYFLIIDKKVRDNSFALGGTIYYVSDGQEANQSCASDNNTGLLPDCSQWSASNNAGPLRTIQKAVNLSNSNYSKKFILIINV